MRMTGIALALLAMLAGCAQSVDVSHVKIIEYGWDKPQPTFVAKNIRQMEQRPFDGVVMLIPKMNLPFTNKPLVEQDFAAELAALPTIKWQRFTDNFIVVNSASSMDWFSDADWQVVAANVTLLAKAAKLGGCKGLCLDPEPYQSSPWQYEKQPWAGEKSFADYQAMVRKRGAQFMAAIQGQMPKTTLMTFFLLSQVLPDQPLERQKYGLLPAFLDGLLDAAGPDTVIVDGNEASYYYGRASQYGAACDRIHGGLLDRVAPGNWSKYRAKVQCGQALFVDLVYGLLKPPGPAGYLTPAQRNEWFEHHVYWAVQNTDRYVWVYSGNMNWWTDKDVPPGIVDAIVSGRAKAKAGLPLGLDNIEAAWARARLLNEQNKP